MQSFSNEEIHGQCLIVCTREDENYPGWQNVQENEVTIDVEMLAPEKMRIMQNDEICERLKSQFVLRCLHQRK